MGLGTDHTLSGATKASGAEHREHEAALYAKRYVQIETNQEGRWAYNEDSTVLYAGYAPKDLAEGTDGWLLHKFTYDESKRVIKREIAYGNWTGKASAGWDE